MENNMILHEDKKVFIDAIRITSDYYGTREIFVEKDYWATYLLKKLSQSDFKDKVVFKGGTSLSKAYDLINRFSEDVDLAILNAKDYSGNAIKELIKRVEETLTIGLIEVELEGITSKHSKIRRTAFNYEKVIRHKGDAGILDKIVLEINSFTNPLPYEERLIDCMIGKFFYEKGFLYFREKYGIKSFTVNTLSPRQTLVEKLVSLFRFSFSDNPGKILESKIRHFYDIYFLTESKYCKDYIESKEFMDDFKAMYDEDILKFDEPENWRGSKMKDSPLITSFSNIWDHLSPIYERELGGLVYGSLISHKLIHERSTYIINRIADY